MGLIGGSVYSCISHELQEPSAKSSGGNIVVGLSDRDKKVIRESSSHFLADLSQGSSNL